MPPESERTPLSLWETSAQEADIASPLQSDRTAEVAIVGGGYTGLSTALHAAEKGIACHLLEARQIGYGGSGRNAGLVNAGLWLPPQDVRAKLGETRGGALIATLGDAPAYVMSLIERHQMRCELQRNGTIHAAHSPKGYEDLASRAQEWQRLGAPVELLSKSEAAEKIGSDAFYGGLLDRRAGTINPMGYVRGLARAAIAAGATLSTGTSAKALTRDNDSWAVDTDRGRITAKTVVLATNAYTDRLWPDLSKTFTPIHYFQLATAPLGKRAKHILHEGQGLWDTGRIMSSLRRDAEGRLLVGSMGSVVEGFGNLSRRWAERRLARLFPALGPVAFEASWHGRIAMTPDHLPRILKLAEGLYTPIGYNGRGITTGTIFGRALADLLSGQDEAALPLPISDPETLPTAPLRARLYRMAFTANQIWKSL